MMFIRDMISFMASLLIDTIIRHTNVTSQSMSHVTYTFKIIRYSILTIIYLPKFLIIILLYVHYSA